MARECEAELREVEEVVGDLLKLKLPEKKKPEYAAEVEAT
jgi:hypothetical protein